MPDSGFVVVAHVVRTQGRNGELIADLLTDFPDRFAKLPSVWMLPPGPSAEPRELAIERHWLHKGRVVVKLAGVNSIGDAAVYRGWDIAIPREQRIPLRDDSVYIADLIGCHLINETDGSADLGPVIDVVRGEGGSADLLVVKKAQDELVIPFAKSYVVAVDLDSRILRMRLPLGLIQINAPITDDERAAQQKAAERDNSEDAL